MLDCWILEMEGMKKIVLWWMQIPVFSSANSRQLVCFCRNEFVPSVIPVGSSGSSSTWRIILGFATIMPSVS